MALAGTTNEEKIWFFLIENGLTPQGAAGLMGNLLDESVLDPKNLEDQYERKLGFTNDSYTAAVDNGTYPNFVRDAAGYGLAQWTYWTRKQKLLNFAKSKGVSIGDLEMQLQFLLKELSENFTGVLRTLKTTNNILTASNAVLLQYECPANTGASTQSRRATYGTKYYSKYANKTAPSKPAEQPAQATTSGFVFTPRLTRPTAGNKYYIRKVSGGYSDAIEGVPKDSQCDVLSNCVGYAYGRFNEIGGYGYCKYLKPSAAELFMMNCGGLKTGAEPKIGACMVWQKGATLSADDGSGHVAIVEKVVSSTQVVTSESAYNGTPFYTMTRNKGTGNWGMNSPYKFLGFIYNPATEGANNVQEDGRVPADQLVFGVGDIVMFKGNMHYVNAFAQTGYNCSPGKVQITAIYANGNHQYHVKNISGGGSTAYGWVDAKSISSVAGTENNTSQNNEDVDANVGDILEFTGNTHYVSSYATIGPRCLPGKVKVTSIAKNAAHKYHVVSVPGGGSTAYGWVNANELKKL